ncbi:MAG TPA: hypothetical protein VJA21_07565, partial [Verrucomicrobiae bacterium]
MRVHAFAVALVFAVVSPFIAASAPPAMRLVKAARAAPSLLRNGDFEQGLDGKLTDWAGAPKAYGVAAKLGRRGSRALVCENTNANEWAGASQTLLLNQSNVNPVIVRGWSKAEAVSGSPDGGYSLYVDIIYQDGTPLWGQTANFRTGTHDWQERELLILPEEPVKSLTLHCILRGHSGRAWFDDVRLEEVKADGDAVVFEGVPIAPGPKGKAPTQQASVRSEEKEKTAVRAVTRDGLELNLENGLVRSLKSGGKDIAGAAPSGFLARDVAAGSDFFGLSGGRECSELGLNLRAEFKGEADHISVEGRIADTTGKDRAVTLLFALPIDAESWRWGDDIRRNRGITGRTEMANAVAVGCGSTGTMSLYPVAAVYGQTEGLALGLDMAKAAQYRLAYHPGTKQFFIAFDFGLVPDTRRFPGAADFRFVIFRFDPEWGFRAAFQKYTRIFPEYFRVRSRDQGIWMPFTDVSTVQGWQDFGFRYHEGNNNVVWDDEHGVLSFRYTEPMTWWMRMEKNLPRTADETLRIRDEMVRSRKGNEARMARVSQTAAMWDESGQPALLFQDTPWCNGAVWSLNPNPDLPGSAAGGTGGDSEARHNAATAQ